MEIKRDIYLEQLKIRKNNGMIKILLVYEDVENHSYCLFCIRNICWRMA